MNINLECKDLIKTYAGQTAPAVNKVSFSIPEGSFFSILGPSGCGKSTLLRLIAGFDRPDSGDISIHGQSILKVPPNKRPVNMVFQDLALFPLMTVAENIAYGLKRKKVKKEVIRRKVEEMLEKIELPHIADRKINQLSGGQKQRVAIARSMVLEPQLLLLDEPLGALDVKIREQMKVALKQLQERFGTTFLYITHDQTEALMMSDQVAVMRAGSFEQIAKPKDLYYAPSTSFVADFVGENNRWQGVVTQLQADTIEIKIDSSCVFHARRLPSIDYQLHQHVDVFVRPEAIVIEPKSGSSFTETNAMEVQVENLLFNAANSKALVGTQNSGVKFSISVPQNSFGRSIQKNDTLHIHFAPEDCFIFPSQGN